MLVWAWVDSVLFWRILAMTAYQISGAGCQNRGEPARNFGQIACPWRGWYDWGKGSGGVFGADPAVCPRQPNLA